MILTCTVCLSGPTSNLRFVLRLQFVSCWWRFARNRLIAVDWNWGTRLSRLLFIVRAKEIYWSRGLVEGITAKCVSFGRCALATRQPVNCLRLSVSERSPRSKQRKAEGICRSREKHPKKSPKSSAESVMAESKTFSRAY